MSKITKTRQKTFSLKSSTKKMNVQMLPKGSCAVMYAQVLVHCTTLSQDCPHGEVAFSNSYINKKKMCDKIVKLHHSFLLWVNDTLWFHFTIKDYYIIQFDNFFCYKDIGSKAFFTMATLIMPVLENEQTTIMVFMKLHC